MELYEYDDRLGRPAQEKIAEFNQDGRLKHVVFARQFDVEQLANLCRMADMIRALAKTKTGAVALEDLLCHKRAMLYFTQPSTRTFLSFMAACQILGITCGEVRDPRTSSAVKRESQFDSIRMFSSYFDLIIMRTEKPRLAECCGYLMNDLDSFKQRSVPVVNAGSGADEHPTQALLDIYTLQRSFDFDTSGGSESPRFSDLKQKYPDLTLGLSNKTYAFCGDMGRGRTVRSLAQLLAQYDNVRLFFISPNHPTLNLGDDIRQSLMGAGIEVREFESLDDEVDGVPLLSVVDCLYVTRVQREHDSEQDARDFAHLDMESCHMSLERVAIMKDYAPILHPFPRDSVCQELPTTIDTDPRAMYFRQARNGVWARAALLTHLFQVEEELVELYQTVLSDNGPS
jgi:aspartate carbamoyltransferase